MFHIHGCVHGGLDGGTPNSWELLHLGKGGESWRSGEWEKRDIHGFFSKYFCVV